MAHTPTPVSPDQQARNDKKRFQIIKRVMDANGDIVGTPQRASTNSRESAYEVFAAASSEIRIERPHGTVEILDNGSPCARYTK